MDLDYNTIDHSNRTTSTNIIDISNNNNNNNSNNNININNNNKIKSNNNSQQPNQHRPTSPKTILSTSPSQQITNKTRSSSQSQSHSPILNNNNNNNNNEDLSSSTEIHQDENQLNSNIFENLGFVIDITINLKRKMELVKIIKKNGGKSCYSCTKATHLITTKQGYIEKTQKVQQALSLGIPILVKEYVHYCAFKKELLPVETYLVSSLISNTSSLSLSQELEVKQIDEDNNDNEAILTPLDISEVITATTTETTDTNLNPINNNNNNHTIPPITSTIQQNITTTTTTTTIQTLESNNLMDNSNNKVDYTLNDCSKAGLSTIDSNTNTMENNYISTEHLSNTLDSIDKVDLEDKQLPVIIQQVQAPQQISDSAISDSTSIHTPLVSTLPPPSHTVIPNTTTTSLLNNNTTSNSTIITPVSILKNPIINNSNSNSLYKIDDAQEESLKNQNELLAKEKKKKFSQKKNHLLNLKKSYQDPVNVSQSRQRKSSGGSTLLEAISDQVNYISNLENYKYYARGSHQLNNSNNINNNNNNNNNNHNSSNNIAINHNGTSSYNSNNKSIRLNEYNLEEELEFEDLEEFDDDDDEEYYEEEEEESDEEESDEESLSEDQYDEEEEEEDSLSDQDVSYNSKFNSRKQLNDDLEFEHHHKQQKIQQLQKQLENLVLNNSGSNVRKLRSYSRDYIDNNIVKSYLNSSSSNNSSSGNNNNNNGEGQTINNRTGIQKSSSLDKILHSPKKRLIPPPQQQQQLNQDSLINNNLFKEELSASPISSSPISSPLSSAKQQSSIDKSNLKNKKKKPFLPPLSTLVHILVTFIILSAFFMSLPNSN